MYDESTALKRLCKPQSKPDGVRVAANGRDGPGCLLKQQPDGLRRGRVLPLAGRVERGPAVLVRGGRVGAGADQDAATS